jgi:hypothetical protein
MEWKENGPCVQFYFQTRLKMETEFYFNVLVLVGK